MIVFRFKDIYGRKGSKTICTPTLHSFLTLFTASCSWQEINCEVVIRGLFFISLAVCMLLSCLEKPGPHRELCHSLADSARCTSSPTVCPGLRGPPLPSGAFHAVELRVLHRQLPWLQSAGVVQYSGRNY